MKRFTFINGIICWGTFATFTNGDELIKRLSFPEALKEDNLPGLRKGLPAKLEVSGSQVKLSSGKTITFSVLAMIARSEQLHRKWSLMELCDALTNENEHMRCAAFVLLTDETGVHENYTSYCLSIDQLKERKIIDKWRAIVSQKRPVDAK